MVQFYSCSTKFARGKLTHVETGTDSSWPVELCTVVLKPKLITQVQPKGISQIERYFFKDAHMHNVANAFLGKALVLRSQ